MGSPSNGALVQALGGVREDDVAQYLKEHIKEYLPPAGVQPEDLKLELVPSDVNINAAKDAHGVAYRCCFIRCPTRRVFLDWRILWF